MSKLVFAEWAPLSIVKNGARGAYHIMTRGISSANALYESLVGSAAPSKASQSVRSHDHTIHGGGLCLYRGLIYSFDYGEDSGYVSYTRSISGPELSTKVRFFNELASGEPYQRGEQDFFAYISEGHDPASTNRSATGCTLEMKAIVSSFNSSGTGGTATLYLKNVETGTEVSFDHTLIASSSNITQHGLTNIPFKKDGGWQRFVWWIEADKQCDVQINAFQLVETFERTQKISSGASEYHNATTRT